MKEDVGDKVVSVHIFKLTLRKTSIQKVGYNSLFSYGYMHTMIPYLLL